jgi:hypothetical protein
MCRPFVLGGSLQILELKYSGPPRNVEVPQLGVQGAAKTIPAMSLASEKLQS